MSDKTYIDKVKCPEGHKFSLSRRIGTAGKKVRTYCAFCKRAHQIVAGLLPKPKGEQHG